MEINQVYYIKNMPGLYLLLEGRNGGLIVESLVDGRRTFVSDRGTISNLAIGGVFVKGGLMPLEEVFSKMKMASIAPPPASADKKELFGYMKTIVTNLDEESNHASFIKKIINWYSLLDGKIEVRS